MSEEETSGKLLVYRSSAGSGKTSTLVSTFLELALADNDPSRYGRILAITFTNKAAKEMRERVLRELSLLANGRSPTPPTRASVQKLGCSEEELQQLAGRTLTHLLHHYSRLSISTIDRFVHRIVQQFARELDLPVDFELVLEEEELLQRAVDQLIARAGHSEKDLTHALTKFASEKASEDKSWHIEQDLLEASQTLLKEEGQEAWQKVSELEIGTIETVRQRIQKKRKAFEEKIEGIAHRAFSLIEREGIHPKSFYSGEKGGVPAFLKGLLSKDPSRFNPSSPLFKTLEEDKWTSAKCPKDEAERIHAISGELRSFLQEAVDAVQQEGTIHRFHTLIQQELHRLSLLSSVEEGMDRIKEEEGLLLISDLDRIIAQLIQKEPAPFIYERIGDRYDHLLFDEFQDTSVLQWQNLLPLVENSLSEGNTVMLVGDGKQAIYRWRNGDVEQFLKLPALHQSGEKGAIAAEKEALLRSHYKEEELIENFRSAPLLVRTNNELFPVMNRILMQGAEDAGMDHLKGLFDNPGQKAGRTDESGHVRFEAFPRMTNAEKEAEGDPIIERIIELIQGPLDGASLSDIAILTRTNARGAEIAGALMEQGIDVLSGESLHLDQSREVNLLIAVMRLIEDPFNELAKLACIRYYLEREGRVEEMHTRIHPHLEEGEKENRIDIAAFWEEEGTPFDLESARRTPLYRSAENAIRCFGLDDPPSPYLQFFLDHVHERTERYGNDLKGFLEEWDAMKSKPSIKVPQGMEAVRVMTIHSAKGLEFPYLILPDPQDRIAYSKKRIWVDPDGYIPELPAALLPMKKALQDCPPPFAKEEAQERYRTRLDALNLFYVAMTRAQEALYVLFSMPSPNADPGKGIDKTLLKALEELYGKLPEEGLLFGKPPSPGSSDAGAELKGGLAWIPHEAWDDRVQIRFRVPDEEELMGTDAERERGKLTHEALARIEGSEDPPRVLKELESEGKIPAEQREDLERTLQAIITHEGSAAFFDPSPDQKLLNEREILTKDGNFIRPDRVLIEGMDAKVLEIKTGSPSNRDHEQLKKYVDALKQMGYRAEGYLLYTEGPDIVPFQEGLSAK
ncbi:MAG: UvrD-helicase domain-containing protein [Flavobacteriales bacterium]